MGGAQGAGCWAERGWMELLALEDCAQLVTVPLGGGCWGAAAMAARKEYV